MPFTDLAYDRTTGWRAFKRRVRFATEAEQERLLRKFGNEVSVLTTLALRSSRHKWQMNSCLELANVVGVVAGAGFAADPGNPDWFARDRLFLTRLSDLPSACSVLSAIGFFPPDAIPQHIDAAADGGPAAIPGLEAAGSSIDDILGRVWESAAESARSKRRWRDLFDSEAGHGWASPAWSRAASVWRTFVVVGAEDETAEACRQLPMRNDDTHAGLVAVVAAARDEARNLAEAWRASGWEVLTVARSDLRGLYYSLTAPTSAKPLAILLSSAQSGFIDASATRHFTRQGALLGELSDEQFQSIMDESLQF